MMYDQNSQYQYPHQQYYPYPAGSHTWTTGPVVFYNEASQHIALMDQLTKLNDTMKRIADSLQYGLERPR